MLAPRNIVGGIVASLRRERRLSQAGLAVALQRFGWDVSRDVVIRIENLRRQVSDFEIAILAAVLEVPASKFFEVEYTEKELLQIAGGMNKARPGRKPKA